MLPIETAQPQDAAVIGELLAELGYAAEASQVVRRLSRLLDHPDCQVLVARRQGRVVAFLSLQCLPELGLPDDCCRIGYFCVARPLRGQGIGNALLEQAETWARQRGCGRLELHCALARQQAQRFYAHQGYQAAPELLRKALS